MFGRSPAHAATTARARRLRAAGRDRERQEGAATPWGPPAGGADEVAPIAIPRKRRPVRLRRVIGTAVVLLLLVTVVGSVLLWQRVSAFNQKVSSAPMAST